MQPPPIPRTTARPEANRPPAAPPTPREDPSIRPLLSELSEEDFARGFVGRSTESSAPVSAPLVQPQQPQQPQQRSGNASLIVSAIALGGAIVFAALRIGGAIGAPHHGDAITVQGNAPVVVQQPVATSQAMPTPQPIAAPTVVTPAPVVPTPSEPSKVAVAKPELALDAKGVKTDSPKLPIEPAAPKAIAPVKTATKAAAAKTETPSTEPAPAPAPKPDDKSALDNAGF